jgi:hypothetical protein
MAMVEDWEFDEKQEFEHRSRALSRAGNMFPYSNLQ